MRILITGVSGFVGSHLAEFALAAGQEVFGFDAAGHHANLADLKECDGFRLVTGDVRDAEAVHSVVSRDIDLVFHLAAVVGVHRYIDDPFGVVDVNVTGTRNVLRACLDSGSRIVVASTSEVYGRNPKVPWSETDDRVLGATTVDRWSYSTAKAAAEHLALGVNRQSGLPVSVVRYFNAYGPRQAPHYVISRNVQRALNGEPLVVYDGGRQSRCFTYIADIVEGTWAVGTQESSIGEVFNLGATRETTILSAVETIARVAGLGAVTENLDTGSRFGRSYEDIERRVPDCTKAERMLGWSATTSLNEGIERFLDWARIHPEWLAARSTLDSAPTTTVTAAP